MSPSQPGDSAQRRLLAIVLGVALAGFGYTLCLRGIVMSDEGYLLQQSWDMAQGKVLYRDMDSFVAPGVWFLISGLFRVFDPSIFISRLAALACFVAVVLVCARIVERVASPRAALCSVAAFAAACVWSFPSWTWSFYSVYAVLFAMAALERLLAWREKGSGSDLVWVGVLLGLSITFKQNYGVLALLGAALAAFAIRLEAAGSLRAAFEGASAVAGRVALGMATVGLPVAGYFAYHGALPHLFQALVVHPFTSFLGQHDIAYLPPSQLFDLELWDGIGRLTYGAYGLTNGNLIYTWPSAAVRAVELLHVLLYWLPPAAFAAGAGLVLRSLRRGSFDGGLAAVLAFSSCLFIGVFPRADFNHLMNVYQPVIVAVVVVLARMVGLGAALGRGSRVLLVGLGGVLVAGYAGLALFWYVDLRALLSVELDLPRGGVFLSAEHKQMIDFEVGQIRANTRPGETVLTLPAMSMLNFLADRPVPGRYYNHYAVHIGHDGGESVVRGLEESSTRLVVADYYSFFSQVEGMREYAPRLARYLRSHFIPSGSVAIDEHLLLSRRPRPLPERELINVLEHCDVGVQDWRARGVVEHLLFDSLYHPHQVGPVPLRRQAETQCRVSVPEGAQLSFAVGYRQPTGTTRDTVLRAEIWIRPTEKLGAPYQQIYGETLNLARVGGWLSPPHAERRLDLSRWGGKEVWILFRTRYEGEARMNPLDLRGFAMLWQDPQLEYQPEDTAESR